MVGLEEGEGGDTCSATDRQLHTPNTVCNTILLSLTTSSLYFLAYANEAQAAHYQAAPRNLEHTLRGALVCPIFGAPREVFHVVDCIDADMFLHIHEIK
jgi:hypothetical protein